MPDTMLDRRRLLLDGARLAGGATLLGTASSLLPAGLAPAATTGASLPALPERRARGGRLATSLTLTSGEARLDGRRHGNALLLDGGAPGPTLRLRAGDRLDLAFRNHSGETTNLHFHGLHVSPEGRSDNVFRTARSGTTLRYRLDLPRDHPGGLYWYHPHLHEHAQAQVDRGMFGLIVIEPRGGEPAALAAMRERVIALQHVHFKKDGTINTDPLFNDVATTANLLNRRRMPVIEIRPGESQRWRLGDFTSQWWWTLALDGHAFTVVGEDGNPVRKPYEQASLVLAPAKRWEVVVTAATTPGDHILRSTGYRVDSTFIDAPVELATVRIAGSRVRTVRAPRLLAELRDLRTERVARRRTITLTETIVVNGREVPNSGDSARPITSDGMFGTRNEIKNYTFFVDGKTFDHERTAFSARLGDVEEWTIRNESASDHPFHIHVNPFLVTRRDGKAVPVHGYQDSAVVPRNTTMTLRIAFDDHVGRILFHCHNLFHEDRGMMAMVEVVRGRASASGYVTRSASGDADASGTASSTLVCDLSGTPS